MQSCSSALRCIRYSKFVFWPTILRELNISNVCNLSNCFKQAYFAPIIRDNFSSLSDSSSGHIAKQDLSLQNRSSKLDTPFVGPSLADFINAHHVNHGQHSAIPTSDDNPYISDYLLKASEKAKRVYFETKGCQMNVNDTEIAWSILQSHGYERTDHLVEADVLLIVTCAIRESAEQKIWNKLEALRYLKEKRSKNRPPLKIGVLGCMAERLKEKILDREKCVDLIAGPDSYKDLPRLLAATDSGQAAVNVMLSLDETYADVLPVRLNSDSVTAFVSIMRGCDNMCSYCIVPFTRGRERSRPIDSIVKEISELSKQGVREVTLLGQNVNSYRDKSESAHFGGLEVENVTSNSRGFRTIYRPKVGGRTFSHLLEKVSDVDPEMRIRFTSPHPKDFPDEVLMLIKERKNICNQLHLPAQSGNNNVLQAMRRGYSREAYLELVDRIREIVPNVALSSDFITGFCGETEQAHEDTLTLLERVRYNFVYAFPYSMRQKTHAHHKLDDDVTTDVKNQRMQDVLKGFRKIALEINESAVGSLQNVLIEGPSKRSPLDMVGRCDCGTKVIIAKSQILGELAAGDYVTTHIESCTSQSLKGTALERTTLQTFLANDHLFLERSFQRKACQI